MSKVAGMAKSSAKGGFKLFIGVSISSVFTALSLIIVLRLFGDPDAYGIITTALILPTMLNLFKDWGINSAMIKYLAQYRSEKRIDESRNVMVSGAIFELVTGSLLTLLCFSLAGFLANDVFMLPEAKILIEIASLTIIADSFMKISQSTFVGFEQMEYYSLVQILNSCIRLLLAPLLVFLGFSVFGAIVGQIVAILTAGICGLIVFYFKFYRITGKEATTKTNLTKTLKLMLRYGLPLSVTAVAVGFLPQFYNTLFTQSFLKYETALGNYQTAVNFTVVVTFFTVPITTVLFPAFSKIKAKAEKNILNTVFQTSVKYGALLTVPVTFMVMVLSEQIVFTVVQTTYSDAPFFLTLYALYFLYVAIGSISVPTFLNGQGKTDLTMRMSFITLFFGLITGVIFIPWLGIVGLIIANTVSGAPSILLGLYWVKKYFGASIDWKASAKILLASIIATAVTYFAVEQLHFSNAVELVIGGVTFLLVYLVAAPLIRAVDKNDVENLREMLSGLGPFSPIFNLPLKVIEILLDVFDFKRK